jgi:GNAT superfamily N-acetyltransferase
MRPTKGKLMKRFLRQRRKKGAKPKCKWMIRRNLPEVKTIEDKSFSQAWTEDVFCEWLNRETSIGMIAEWRNKIVGFALYELRKGETILWKLAVHPKFRRRGIGRALLRHIAAKAMRNERQLFAYCNPYNAPTDNPCLVRQFFVASDSQNGRREHMIRIVS